MTEPIRCPRCRRAFGGEQAYRRGHRRYHGDGKGIRERCRSVRELRRSPYLRVNGDSVWHVRHRDDPGQMFLPIFRRGRPPTVSALPIFRLGTRDGRMVEVRRRVRKAPLAAILDDEVAA